MGGYESSIVSSCCSFHAFSGSVSSEKSGGVLSHSRSRAIRYEFTFSTHGSWAILRPQCLLCSTLQTPVSSVLHLQMSLHHQGTCLSPQTCRFWWWVAYPRFFHSRAATRLSCLSSSDVLVVGSIPEVLPVRGP